MEAFGHTLTLETMGLRLEETMVYFWKDEGVARNVLGCAGWLQRVLLAIHDYEMSVFLEDARLANPEETR